MSLTGVCYNQHMEIPQSDADNTITHATKAAVAEVLNMPLDSVQTQVVGGGYSRNRRSLMGNDERWVFVKEVDVSLLPDAGDEELWWLQKDYLCTEALRSVVPEVIPEWVQLHVDDHALVMTSYRSEDGWLWTPPDDDDLQQQYIQAVVDATKRLEDVQFDEEMIETLKLQPYFRDMLALDDGFALVVQNEAIRNRLKEKYTAFAEDESGRLARQHRQLLALLNDESDLQRLADNAAQLLKQPNDSFGHCDVRSDNLAFHPESGEIKLVDWNWASYTPKRFGATEFLIDMARRGADVSQWADELNAELLAATVGFYLNRCLKDPLAPGNTLRDMQAESAAVAFDLYRRVLPL